jgi:hypothetical protein
MPKKEGTLSQDPGVGRPQQMLSDSEEIQDDSVDRQESLRLKRYLNSQFEGRANTLERCRDLSATPSLSSAIARRFSSKS